MKTAEVCRKHGISQNSFNKWKAKNGGPDMSDARNLIRLYGKPASIVGDNGTELTSRAILEWQNKTGVAWYCIAPGKPSQNAFIGSCNGRLQDGC